MKAKLKLGALVIEVEADDLPTLLKETTKIQKLNIAATQEGWNTDECLPYSEKGPDGRYYSGFINLVTNERIKFGILDDGTGDFYVRFRGGKHYKGPFTFTYDAGDTSRQLEEETPSSREAKRAPAPEQKPNGRPAIEKPRPGPVGQSSFDTGAPLNDNQRKAITRIVKRIYGFDEVGSNEINAALLGADMPILDNLSESQGAEAIVALQRLQTA